MHYCQACDTAQLMEPSADAAACAACGRTDPLARRADLFVVTGASGAGKTTVFEPLLAELAGRCMVFDVDWLIDPLSRQAGGVDWVAFRDAWLHVAHGVAQNGLPTMLLGPFIPEHLAGLPGRRWVADIHFVTLDCDDDERRRRIEARPAWRGRDIDEQVEFGRWLRDNLPTVDTGSCSPADTARAIASWWRETSQG
jgi:predicted ABC-type ATPase